MQVCHGKAAPLRRLSPGDQVVYYSPLWQFGGQQRCQHFTALGTVTDAVPYQVQCAGGFQPYRLNIQWQPYGICPIQPLLPLLDWTRQQQNWGFKLRFGLFELSARDMAQIRIAMQQSAMTLPYIAAQTEELSLQTPMQGQLALDPALPRSPA